MAQAKTAIKKILSSYPDYSKAPAEYVLVLVEVMATYPEAIQTKLTDYRTGIPATCEFLPSVANLVKMADELQALNGRKPIKYTLGGNVDTTEWTEEQWQNAVSTVKMAHAVGQAGDLWNHLWGDTRDIPAHLLDAETCRLLRITDLSRQKRP